MKTILSFLSVVTSVTLMSQVSLAKCQPTKNVELEQVEKIFDFIWANMSDSLKTKNVDPPYEPQLSINEGLGGLNVNTYESSPSSNNIPAIVMITGDSSNFEDKNPMQVALILAHEIGHIIGHPGGDSYYAASVGMTFAVEGEADYQSALILKDVFRNNPEKAEELLICSSIIDEDINLATLNFYGANLWILSAHLMNLKSLMEITGDAKVDPEDVDPTVVDATIYDYPSLQARYDTVLAALMGVGRPRSWALPEAFEE